MNSGCDDVVVCVGDACLADVANDVDEDEDEDEYEDEYEEGET